MAGAGENVRLAALTRYGRRGASSRVRFQQFFPDLGAKGFALTSMPLFGDDYLDRLYRGGGRNAMEVAGSYVRRVGQLMRRREFDVFWIEKELLPFVPAFAEFLLLGSTPYVIDYDDAVFHNYDRHRSGLVRRLLGEKIDRLMRRAVVVTAGNDYLAERAVRAGASRVEVIPTVVDLTRYRTLETTREGQFTIGWIGSPSTEAYLSPLERALTAVVADGRSRVVAVGASRPPITPGGESWPWNEDGEVDAIRRFDVGIMPLTDDPWSRGKCAYKLIQYMACGKAVVASPVGANCEVVQHGVNGFLASTEEEWIDALTRLRDEPAFRASMGAAGRGVVEQRYNMHVVADRLATILRTAAEGER